MYRLLHGAHSQTKGEGASSANWNREAGRQTRRTPVDQTMCRLCKLAYSARTVPPSLHLAALHDFSSDLRVALGNLLEDLVPARCWHLAQLGIAQGGVGTRERERHCYAAYVSSVLVSSDLCRSVDAEYDVHDPDSGRELAKALRELDGSVLESARLGVADGPKSQK